MQTIDLGAGRGWLDTDAAKSIARIDAQIGHPQQITEAGRTWAQQKRHWDTYQRNGSPIALHPDAPSIHQLGNAIDTDERHVAVLNDHGWYQTVYRRGVLVEPWHFEYFANRDNHYGEEPEMDYATFASYLQRALRFDVRPNGVGATWEHGPTLWERLNQIQAAQVGVTINADAVAQAVVDAIPDDLARDILNGLSKRLAE